MKNRASANTAINAIDTILVDQLDYPSGIGPPFDSTVFTQYIEILGIQKQPLRGGLRKRCSENMRQIYRRTPMLQCNYSKVTKQVY